MQDTNAPATKMVIKRDGTTQPFSVEKLQNRVNNLLDGLKSEFMGIPGCIAKVEKYAQNCKFTNSLTF
jgi:transcriptional regulator NrdR family protein